MPKRVDQSIGPEERFLSAATLAVRWDVSEKTVRRMIAAGKLPAHRIGRLLRIGDRDAAACQAEARLGKGQPK